MTWLQTPQARAILSRLTVGDVTPVIATPVVGDRYYRWSAGEKHERLNAIRNAAFEAHHGTFAEAYKAGWHHEYLELDSEWPTVEAVLADRFGDPLVLFGTPPRFGDGGEARAAWDAMRRDGARVAA